MRLRTHLALFLAAAACTTAKQAPMPAPFGGGPADCSDLPEASVELSERDRCRVFLLAARCTVADKCLVACIRNGEGKNIGGGCFHICNAYRQWVWEPPTGWDTCPPEPQQLGQFQPQFSLSKSVPPDQRSQRAQLRCRSAAPLKRGVGLT